MGSPPDDFSPQGQDWGFPAAQLRAPPRGWLPPLRRIHPQELPARRRAAHRPRHAPLPPLLDSRGQRRRPGRLRARALRGFCAHTGSRKRAQPGDHRGRRPGHRGAGGPRNAARASACSATACSISRRIRAASSSRPTNTRARRWCLPPRTTSPPWPASGSGRTSRRAAPPACWTRTAGAGKPKPARRKSARCWMCSSNRGSCRPGLPRDVSAYPEMTGDLHNAVVGFLATTPSAASGHQPGRPDQGNWPSRTFPEPPGSTPTGAARCVSRWSSCAPTPKPWATPRCSATGSPIRAGETSRVEG